MSTRKETYEKELTRLRDVLAGKPRSARQLARLLRCSLPTIYDRIAVLAERGFALTLGKARVGKKGPLSTTFISAAEGSELGIYGNSSGAS